MNRITWFVLYWNRFTVFCYYTVISLRIKFNPKKGCHSTIGKGALNIKQSEETMNFAWFDVATIIHEFLHVIGLEHEHQSPHGNPINWDLPKLLDWAVKTQGWDKTMVMKNIVNPLKKDVIGKYDPDSIMLYYYPPEVTKDGKGTKKNRRISLEDMYHINRMYPGGPSTPLYFYESIY